MKNKHSFYSDHPYIQPEKQVQDKKGQGGGGMHKVWEGSSFYPLPSCTGYSTV